MGAQNDKKGKKKVGDEFKEDSIQSTIKSFNIQGKKKKMELTNQDVYDVITELGEGVKYFAVYDGHGAKGKEAAEGLRKELRKKLMNDKKKISKFRDIMRVEQYFKEVYKNIQKKLSNSNDFELSGTCSISVLTIENKMYSINLGDSRCVLGQKKGGDGKKEGEKIGIEMSIDHKPTRDDESKRIAEKGGEVSEKIPGAPRVFRKNDDVPGLAVARSIGDIVAHEVGVSAEPEVFEKDLEPDDQFIVIGSDGIWDAMSSCEVVGFIFQKLEEEKKDDKRSDKSEKNISELLAQECRHRWEILNLFKQKFILEINSNKDNNDGVKEKGSQHNIADIDDITCVINFLSIEKDYD